MPASPPAWQIPLLQITGKLIGLLPPEEGAATSIYLASSPAVQGVSGKYFDKCRPVTSSKESYDAEVARRLWDVSAELVKL